MVNKGQLYRSKAPLNVIAMTAWSGPCTGGDYAVLPAGEDFVISSDPPRGAVSVYCLPVRYDALESYFVSSTDRRNEQYAGYYLCIGLDLIANQCEQIADNA